MNEIIRQNIYIYIIVLTCELNDLFQTHRIPPLENSVKKCKSVIWNAQVSREWSPLQQWFPKGGSQTTLQVVCGLIENAFILISFAAASEMGREGS